MANRRNISWSTAMRDLRNDRTRRAGVREERLRTTAGVRGALELSSWRGRSGRRYVVGVHPTHVIGVGSRNPDALLHKSQEIARRQASGVLGMPTVRHIGQRAHAPPVVKPEVDAPLKIDRRYLLAGA